MMAPRSFHTQTGTTLVEVLITVVLVSVALLGLAGLQMATVQNTNSAAQRYEASVLANDILERMRANRGAAVAGGYNLDLDDDPGGAGLAGDDLDDWMASLSALPGGDGAVDVDANGLATITVSWTDASDDNVDTTDDDVNNPEDVSLSVRTEI
jgi:type IV pilus assembly protein PilV